MGLVRLQRGQGNSGGGGDRSLPTFNVDGGKRNHGEIRRSVMVQAGKGIGRGGEIGGYFSLRCPFVVEINKGPKRPGGLMGGGGGGGGGGGWGGVVRNESTRNKGRKDGSRGRVHT